MEYAVTQGDRALLHATMTKGGDADIGLQYAAKTRDSGLVLDSLAHGADPDFGLSIAIILSDDGCLKAAINAGANANAVVALKSGSSDTKLTALMSVIYYCDESTYPAMLKTLVDGGADIAATYDGHTLLKIAAHKSPARVKAALALGCDPLQVIANGGHKTVLDYVLSQPDQLSTKKEMIDILIAAVPNAAGHKAAPKASKGRAPTDLQIPSDADFKPARLKIPPADGHAP